MLLIKRSPIGIPPHHSIVVVSAFVHRKDGGRKVAVTVSIGGACVCV